MKAAFPTKAVFTKIDGAPLRVPGCHWQASLYLADSELPFPVAIAWLSDYRSTPDPLGVILDFILVPEQFRRRGFATDLIEACEIEFGELSITEVISDAGEGLLESLESMSGEEKSIANA